MSIIAQEHNNITKIIVESLDKKSEISQLISHLESKNTIEINFLNIQMIPKEIVLKLNSIKQHVHIFTNESVLKGYLMNLGFELSYQSNYKNSKPKTLNLEYIVLGGSAGSLSKFIDIIKKLPPSNLSVFVVMHQKANKQSSLSQILQSHTEFYNVIEASSDIKILPSTIYVAPPAKHMIIAGGYIFLTDEAKKNFAKPSISNTFESLSKEYQNTLLAIMVCGYGSDGSDVLEFMQNNGSTVIIQDPMECEAKPMLQNAITTKQYDHIFGIDEINEYITLHIEDDFFNDKDINTFLEKIYEKYGYDYRGYNIKHIKRRVHLFYSTLKPKSFLEFQTIVLGNKNIFKDLFLNISVNITTFFRNPEVFKILRDEVFPKLDSFLDIKIWCAGCSSGEEPYSIAIFLKELGLLDRSLIYATDINDIILKNAQNGLYSKENYNLFLKHYYKAGGDESFSNYFTDHNNFVEVNEEIKDKILFFRHNLALDAKINDFQLIFCRNVLIYFDQDLKNRIFDLFKDSLDSYGFLMLGESESLNSHNKYITLDEKNKIYKRKR